VATGWDAAPVMPDWPGRDDYSGDVLHAADFYCPEGYRDRHVLVVGAGNSGVDIAGHLVHAGARVTVSMRTPPTIVPRQWLGVPLQVLAMIADRLPARIGDEVGALLQRIIFGDLRTHGIPRAPEGFQTIYRRCLRVVACDDGFVAALKAGRIRMVGPIDHFDADDVVLADGTRLRPDAVVAATGYRRGLEAMVGHLGVLGPDGIPLHHDGTEHPAAPRMYFCGFWTTNGGQLRLMPGQARRIARAAARYRAQLSAALADGVDAQTDLRPPLERRRTTRT
jgi:cation diffusion facilitator CzcD-associated flavoprotein CzcO